eukprot:5340631-Prorocentrum_lima.AAC.1
MARKESRDKRLAPRARGETRVGARGSVGVVRFKDKRSQVRIGSCKTSLACWITTSTRVVAL